MSSRPSFSFITLLVSLRSFAASRESSPSLTRGWLNEAPDACSFLQTSVNHHPASDSAAQISEFPVQTALVNANASRVAGPSGSWYWPAGIKVEGPTTQGGKTYAKGVGVSPPSPASSAAVTTTDSPIAKSPSTTIQTDIKAAPITGTAAPTKEEPTTKPTSKPELSADKSTQKENDHEAQQRRQAQQSKPRVHEHEAQQSKRNVTNVTKRKVPLTRAQELHKESHDFSVALTVTTIVFAVVIGLGMMVFIAKRRVVGGEGVSAYLAWGLPALVYCDLCLLVASHMSVGTARHIGGHAPDGDLRPHVFDFDNLFSAVTGLANGGSWMIVTALMICSFLWPYAKLFGTLLVVWLFCCERITRPRATNLLEILETLGKWGFLSAFLMFLNVNIFDIDTPEYTTATYGVLRVHIWLKFHLGAYGLCIAVAASSFLTHWASYEIGSLPNADAAKTSEKEAGQESAEENDDTVVTGQSAQSPSPLDPESQAIIQKRELFKLIVTTLVASVLSITLLVPGAIAGIIGVERGGLVGKLIGKPGANLDISPMELMYSVSGASMFFAVAIGFVLFIAPLAEMLLLIVSTSLASFSEAKCKLTRSIAALINSFNLIDVMLLAGILTVWELPAEVKLNIGYECNAFHKLLTNKPVATVAGEEFTQVDKCFTTKTYTEAGFWILFAGVIARMVAWAAWRQALPIAATSPSSNSPRT